MHAQVATISVLFVLFVAPAIRAEGLLYELPADGAWVRYKVEIQDEDSNEKWTSNGTLTLRSVGVADVEGRRCRWIEVFSEETADGLQASGVDKLLIPESELAAGKEPLKHVRRYWSAKNGGQPRIELNNSVRLRSLARYVLHGPFSEAKDLEPVEIETELGKLTCKGTTATEAVKDEQGDPIQHAITIRRHDSVPFGVAALDLEARLTLENNIFTSKVSFKLLDHGADAKSEIPDAK